MLSNLDIQHKKSLRTAEFIRQLSERIQPEIIRPNFQLWRFMELEDYLSNPAYRVSRLLEDVQHSDGDGFEVRITLPDGREISENEFIKWTVVGRGEINPIHKKYGSEFTRIESCERDLNHPIVMPRNHCGKLTCPNCCQYEIQYAAIEQAIKILTGAKYAELNNRSDRILQHIEVSPPENMFYMFLTIEGFLKMRAYATKVATDAGIKGGLIIFHPYRQNGRNDNDELPEDYNPVMANDGDKHHARFYPHFHVIGFGWLNPSSQAFIQSHKGWLYSALRTGENRLKSITDVITVIEYVMSHAGAFADDSPAKINRYATGTWIGLCNSYHLSHIGDIRVYVQKLCEECGSPIVAHAVLRDEKGDTTGLEFRGELYSMVKFPIYSDSENRDRMFEIFEEYRGVPVELLQIIENNPHLGVCYMTSRQLDRKLTQPTPIYAKIDNSVHIPDVYADAFIPRWLLRKRAKRKLSKIDSEELEGYPPVQHFVYDPEETPPEEAPPSMDVAIFRIKI